MSHFSKFYNKIFDYSLKKGTHVKFNEMLNFRNINIKHLIPITTKHIYNEIPIRLAKRITDLNNLPFGLSKNHSINKVREWYLISIEELINTNEPKTSEDIIEFKNKIDKIYKRHSTTLSVISKGLYELKMENKISDIEEPNIQLFLNKFHKNRTEIRILLEHYLSFFSEPKGLKWHGIINLETNLEEIINESINNVQIICDSSSINLHINDIIKIECNNKVVLPSIDHYLYYVLFEIIKNSVESIKYKTHPFISIVIKEIDINWILIKINDNGSGISEKNMEKIWYYSFTTSPINNNDIIEQSDFSTKSPLSGFGYGLPISDIYVNFFNSSSNNIKIYSSNNGTSVFIYLKRYII